MCVCMCIPPIVVRQWLGKHVSAATNTSNSRRIVERVCLWVCMCMHLLLLGNNYVHTFTLQRRIVGSVVFCAIRVVSKKVGDEFFSEIFVLCVCVYLFPSLLVLVL
jgi:hypothetical protein